VNCPDTEKLLQFLDDKLSPAEAEEVAAHVRTCRPCQDKLQAIIASQPPLVPPPPPGPLPPGALVGDKYVICRHIARGGQGDVYEARQEEPLVRVVAVKMLFSEGGGRADARFATFRKEAATLAKLTHPNIVPIYDYGEHDGQPYFVMEFLPGGSLGSKVGHVSGTDMSLPPLTTTDGATTAQPSGPPGVPPQAAGPRAVVSCLEKVARAVAYAHSKDVLHLDLKPGNILMNADRSPLVVDFGVAKLLDAEAGAATRAGPCADTPVHGPSAVGDVSVGRPATGFHPGTPPYMAPEQFDASFGPVGKAADVWALGVILYELLTGLKLFPGPSPEAYRAQVCGGSFERPCDVCPRLDSRLEGVILRCLDPSPAARYPSAGALAEDLAAWQRPNRRMWLAAVAGLLIVAPSAAHLWPKPDPEKAYRKHVSPLLAKLRERQKVELIPEYPANGDFFTVRRGDATVAKRVQDGLYIHCQAKCGLVELLPEVPVRSYRVHARLRLVRRLTQEREWGVYVKHRRAVTSQGPQDYFVEVYFSEPTEVQAGRLQLQGSFRARLFGDQVKPARLPFSDYYAWREDGRLSHENAEYTPDLNDPWVEVEITVRPAQVAASFRPCGSAQVAGLPVLLPGDQDSFKNSLRKFKSDPDLARADFEGSALGIYVREAVCTVQGFAVEPLGDTE
jgi:serine/threonine protein kinase